MSTGTGIWNFMWYKIKQWLMPNCNWHDMNELWCGIEMWLITWTLLQMSDSIAIHSQREIIIEWFKDAGRVKKKYIKSQYSVLVSWNKNHYTLILIYSWSV